MRRNKWQGKIISFEGLDGAGKSTQAKIIASQMNLIYIKGLGRDDWLGKITKRFAKTFLFMIETLYVTFFKIIKELKTGKDVLVDKYFFSAASHIPDVNQPLNRLIVSCCRRFIIKPDIVIYFQVEKEERIRRLKKGPYNKFHKMLINDIPWMIERENAYFKAVRDSAVCLFILDTTNLAEEEITQKVKNILNLFLEKRR